jgi:hypothetical protein
LSSFAPAFEQHLMSLGVVPTVPTLFATLAASAETVEVDLVGDGRHRRLDVAISELVDVQRQFLRAEREVDVELRRQRDRQRRFVHVFEVQRGAGRTDEAVRLARVDGRADLRALDTANSLSVVAVRAAR